MHSNSQYGTTWWSDHRVFHHSIRYHMVVRSSCIPPVNTVPRGGQITVHSTIQYSTTWWSDHRAFYQSIQYHMEVKSLYIQSVKRVPHGGQIIVYSTSQYNTTWRSDHRVFHRSIKLVRKGAGLGAPGGTLCDADRPFVKNLHVYIVLVLGLSFVCYRILTKCPKAVSAPDRTGV